jgi:hypothetical protein
VWKKIEIADFLKTEGIVTDVLSQAAEELVPSRSREGNLPLRRWRPDE